MLLPARYFPIRHRRYEVSPGLFPLETDFGNGEADKRVFQIDMQFSRYCANKNACRQERLSKYVCFADYNDVTDQAVSRWMRARLTTEYPEQFTWQNEADGMGTLCCALTDERLPFDAGLRLRPGTIYANAFDALCCQVPEDVAVVRRDETERNWIAALHLCAPSRWAAEEKVGTDFGQTHAPVPHFEKIARAAGPLLHTVITRAPQVRFAWSVTLDDRLNDHPEPPIHAQCPTPSATPTFLRVERQTLWGLPEVNAFVFTIRTYLYPIAELTPSEQVDLAAALDSMSLQTRRYKGVGNPL